jgi:serine/threonine-protein kinase
MAVLRQVRTDYPVAPTRRRPGIPKELEDICLRCLEKRPLRRYATAQGLADDLRRFLGGQRPDAARDRPRRMWRAWWKYVAVFALSLCLAGTAVALYLNDPERHLERVHRTLKEGRPVTLIGPTGAPKWFRWRTGEGSRTSLDQDGTFFVDTWSLALLELVVDPHQDRYRFSAWVRHRRGDLNGKVGIYVARQAYPWSPSEVHFFTPLTFDGLGSEADERAKVPPAIRDRLPPPRPNRAELAPHLRSDERRGDPINETMGRALGPGFPAGPEAEQPWRHLELTVTPERVTARWEGSPFAMTAADIQRGVDFQVADMRRRPRYRDDPFVQRLQPVFDVRGGLGLFIRRGAASFRDVEVTPIKEAD